MRARRARRARRDACPALSDKTCAVKPRAVRAPGDEHSSVLQQRNSRFATSSAPSHELSASRLMASGEPLRGTPRAPAPPPADHANGIASSSQHGGLWLVDYGAGNVQSVGEALRAELMRQIARQLIDAARLRVSMDSRAERL